MLNLMKISKIIEEKENFIKFCEINDLIPINKNCLKCGDICRKYFGSKDGYFGAFQCSKSKCSFKISVAKNTWFSNSNLKPESILLISYFFSKNIKKYGNIKEDCNLYIPNQNGYLKNISSRTIASKYFSGNKFLVNFPTNSQ